MNALSKALSFGARCFPNKAVVLGKPKYCQTILACNSSTATVENVERKRGSRYSFNGYSVTILGGTGYVGNYICNHLARVGTQVIIAYRCDPYDIRALKVHGDLGQILFVPMNAENDDDIRKAIKYSDVVVNLIGKEVETRNFNYHTVNVSLPKRIAQICKEMGTKKLIHFSALNSQEDHEGFLQKGGSRFLQSKGEGEKAVREAFPEAIIFRPSDIFGNDDKFIRYYLGVFRRTFPSIFSLPNCGKGIWKQPVYVGDIAQAVTNAVFDPDIEGWTFEAVGSRRYELYDLVSYILESAKKDTSIMDLKYDLLMRLRVYALEKIRINMPYGMLTPEKLEREAISDKTTGLPNLEDLGITQFTTLEDRLEFEARHLHSETLNTELGRYEKASPPRYIDPSALKITH